MSRHQPPRSPDGADRKPGIGKPGDWKHVGHGLLMGGADVIPGVSGGTVALILGIYERLVTAVSHFDVALLGHLRRRRWRAAAAHIDFGFLAALGTGIGLGVVLLAGLMDWLLKNRLEQTYAAFFGMILASSWIVARLVSRWTVGTVLLLVVGVAVGFVIVGLPMLQDPPGGPLYLFFCGTVAICAMILPGISGSFILVLLGMYQFVTGTLKDLLGGLRHGAIPADHLLVLGSFGLGCALGLVSFSKFLRWLLARYEAATMAVLCGFMLGSLRKIWPFKAPAGENIWPDPSAAGTWITLGILVAAGLAVLGIEIWAARHGHDPKDELEPLEHPEPAVHA